MSEQELQYEVVEQMVAQPQLIQDPTTGEFQVTCNYVKPNCGGGKFCGELIDVRIKPIKEQQGQFHLSVKPQNQKVMGGMASVRVLCGEKELAVVDGFSSSTPHIDLEFNTNV